MCTIAESGATDHIPVKADLSDLADVIAWCKTHDAECKRIVENAEKLYSRLINLEGQLDYMQLMTYHIAKRYGGVFTSLCTTTLVFVALQTFAA